jgi:hypothetical protein
MLDNFARLINEHNANDPPKQMAHNEVHVQRLIVYCIAGTVIVNGRVN